MMLFSKFALLLAPFAVASPIEKRDVAQALSDLKQTSTSLITATNQLKAWPGPSSGGYGAIQALQSIQIIASNWNKSAADATTIPSGSCADVTNLFNYIQSNLSTVSQTWVNTVVGRKADLSAYNLQPAIFNAGSNLREQVIKIFDVLTPKACTAGQGRDLKDTVESFYTFIIYSYAPTTDGPPTSFQDADFLNSDGSAFTTKVNNLALNGDDLYRLFSYFKHYLNDLNQTNTDFGLYYAFGCANSKTIANQFATTVAPGVRNLLTALNSKKAGITSLGTFYRGRVEVYLQSAQPLTQTLGRLLLARVCSSYRSSITSTFNALDSYYVTAVNTYKG